jgi:cation diffusion facilitator CzcD-associated flavoprotein CzcO
MDSTGLHRVVIIGGGFSGLHAAKAFGVGITARAKAGHSSSRARSLTPSSNAEEAPLETPLPLRAPRLGCSTR